MIKRPSLTRDAKAMSRSARQTRSAVRTAHRSVPATRNPAPEVTEEEATRSGLWQLIAVIAVTVGAWFLFNGTANASESTPAPAPIADATAPESEPQTFYVVPDVDGDHTAACLLRLGWTGRTGDHMEAIYAPTYVIAGCKRAPAGMIPISIDDASPTVWAQLLAIGYRDDSTIDDDGTVIFVTPGVLSALSRIEFGINR